MNTKTRWFIFLLTLFLLSAPVLVVAQWPDWPVPEEDAMIPNPVEKTPSAINNGRVLYETQCAACHGPRGLGDGAIASPNMTTEAFAAQTDGAIFYKLQQGRGQMPSFAHLPDEELWEVILFLRTFTEPIEVAEKINTLVKIETTEINQEKSVTVTAWEVTDENHLVPLQNVRIQLGVQRMFGVLPLAQQALFTNEEGGVSAIFPNDIPTDTTGHSTLVAFIDDPVYESSFTTKDVPWGQTWEIIDITQKRTLWGTMSSVPLWLLFSFIAIAGAFWITIMWVVLQTKKIFDQGRKAIRLQQESA